MNEHDKLFKKVQSIKENAVDLIETTFPQEVLDILDLNSLTLDNTSYIDKRLKEYYSDLVYNCSSKNSVSIKISILFEHKSYKPDNEYLQLLRYMLNIWEYQTKNKESITPVIPVIFYHDNEEWNYRKFATFFNITESSKLKQFIPDFQYILTDITKYDNEVIKKQLFKREFNKAMTLLFKNSKDERNLLENLHDIFEILKEYIEDDEKRDEIVAFIIYIMNISEIPEQKLIDIINTVSENGGDAIMTTAMKIKNEGKIEGKNEGKIEGKREDAIMMIMEGFKSDVISRITGLKFDEIEKLRK